MRRTPITVEARIASPRLVGVLCFSARLAAAVVVTIAVAGLFGWAFHVRWLVAPMAGLPRLVPNDALMLLFGGLSLGLSLGRDSRLRWAGNVLAMTGGSLALATLAQDVIGRDFGIDTLLGHVQLARPAVATSLGLLFADGALLLLDVGPRRVPTPSELLATAAAIAGWLMPGSYLYGGEEFYDLSAYPHAPGMAPQTALALITLAMGTLAARPDIGAMATLSSAHVGGQAARRTLPIALSIPFLGFFAALAQRTVLHRPPGGAVTELVEVVGGMIAAVAIALAVGRYLDSTDAERRRVEQETREWKRFFECATFGAVMASGDERLATINAAFASMHGYAVDELEGRPVTDLFAPERHAELEDKMRLVEQQGHCRWESEHVRKDGTVFPVFVDVTAVCDDQGRLLYRAAYVQDISEQKQAEAARARLASLVESSDDVIVAEALDGTVLDWNQAAERVFGYSAREMVGHPMDAIIPGELREERWAMRARALAGETIVGCESERVRKDGRRIPIALTLSPIRDPVGRVVGVSTIERDISTLKRLEREREEWSAVVAHDLRQPAASIRLATESLARAEHDPSRQRMLERIRKASDRLERMINDLLDVSRIESGRLAVRAASVDLRPLVSEVVAQQPGVEGRCRVEIDPDAERAWVDGERFVQVLSNLVTNAAKYGDPGTPVEVCVALVEGKVQVTVTNEGPGISQDEIPKLFSRFARTRAAQGSGVPGLGLGLYICRGVVEAHGGRLWVDSVPGEKTHFHFTLPRATDGGPVRPRAGAGRRAAAR